MTLGYAGAQCDLKTDETSSLDALVQNGKPLGPRSGSRAQLRRQR
jgi:hypothetical protein